MLLTLLKAYIQRLKPDGSMDGTPFPVQFNPTEYTLSKGAQIAEIPVPGLDQPILQFVRGQTETMSLDLFFDSTEDGTGAGATPVTGKTDQFYQLIKIDKETHAPPILRFMWGQQGFAGANMTGNWSSQARSDGFQCVVESVKQRFTFSVRRHSSARRAHGEPARVLQPGRAGPKNRFSLSRPYTFLRGAAR